MSNATSPFQPHGTEVVKGGEWQQHLQQLNGYTSSWGSAKYRLQFESQLSQITNMNGGDFAYIITNGNLWWFNAFTSKWQKVAFVMS